ncbi:hypothetical protein BDA99DRAFT_263576 [Phascolomyces articulosus]|uniref:DNA (cytosine-5-)-methyltransferase n=1 Tax=Phascolomyces articulosus TaxID=60185 RepID=A0AAD5JYA6_9FUNG|nr:hypothetical protein BDA99DRAFT_263576 [Phascolomyces articulosus]
MTVEFFYLIIVIQIFQCYSYETEPYLCSIVLSYCTAWPGFSRRLASMDGDNLLRCVVTDDGPRNDNIVGGAKAAVNIAPTQGLAGSEHHPFVIIGNLEGWCKYSNTHLVRRRVEYDFQNIAYKLNYDSQTTEFRYIDGIPAMTLDQVKKENPALMFVENIASVRKCTWCPNRISSSWAASAGAAGLCRIDFLGRGSTWT